MRYATYDGSGELTGCYLQDVVPEHEAAHIQISGEVANDWVNYRMAVDFSAIERKQSAEPNLVHLTEVAIAKTYRDVDDVYSAAIGQRGPEYQDAEAAARAFVLAGYEGDVDEDVSNFALNNPTGESQSNAWAADQIIARANAFRAAQKAMRSARFEHQAIMRAAVSSDELVTAVAAWDGVIAGIRTQLGL